MKMHLGAFAKLVSFLALLASLPAMAAGPQLINRYTGPRVQESAPNVRSAGTPVRFNMEQMLALRHLDEVELSLPDGTAHPFTFELAQSHGDGIHSWIAKHRDLGNHHRAIVTTGPGGSYGVLSTPQGEYRLVPGVGHDWLVDMTAEQPFLPLPGFENDAIRPPPVPKRLDAIQNRAEMRLAIPGVNSVGSPKATPTPQYVVDLMVVYTRGLADALGSTLMTRLNFLVTRANTAYADSEIAITLRLVNAVMVDYSDATGNSTALSAITPVGAGGTGVFANIEAARTASGADLVAMLRNGGTFSGSGVAWVGSSSPSSMPQYMYSVTTGCTQGCESVFIHELGHNMGNMHDRATVAWQDGGVATPDTGAYAFSFGYAYCSSGALSCNPNLPPGSGGCPSNQQPECSTSGGSNFADIMAYFNASAQRLYKFSNPDVTCVSTAAGSDGIARPCGAASAAANSANTAASMNANAASLSAIKSSVSGTNLPGSLQFTATFFTAAESTGTLNLTVSRVGGSAGAVSVSYATTDGSAIAGLDYVSTAGNLTWADGDTANKTISVPLTNDGVDENGEGFTVTLSNPSGAAGVFLGHPSSAAATISSVWPPGGTMPAGFVTPDGSAGAWTTATDRVYEGSTSLRSAQVFGDMTNHTNSDLTYTGTFTAGTVSFAYNVSSWANPGFFTYGFFEFTVDGVAVLSDSGETGWKTFSTSITAGSHTLKWRFRNALSSFCNGGWNPQAPGGASCADRAWIDALVLPLALPNPTNVLTSSANPSVAGAAVTFTATLGGASGTPTGIVNFKNAGTNIAGCAPVAVSSGVATCTTSALAVGTHAITAQYSGNATYNTFVSNTVNQQVNAAAGAPKRLDFNGDSKRDVFLQNANGALYVWHIDGAAITAGNVTITTSGNLPQLPSGWDVVANAADFNGDGKADLLLQHTGGALYAWMIDGSVINSGYLSMPSNGNLPVLPTGWSIGGTGDFNGDGKTDILLKHTNGALYVWMIDGAVLSGGYLSIPTSGNLPQLTSGWGYAGIGDFNGDGKADILIKNTNGALYVWMIDGAAISGGNVTIASGGNLPQLTSGWDFAGIGDFDGNGKEDILLQNANGALYVWLIDGSVISGGSVSIPNGGNLPLLSGGWGLGGIGDHDGNGKADILLQNTNGALYLWTIDGAAISGGNVPIPTNGNLPQLSSGWANKFMR